MQSRSLCQEHSLPTWRHSCPRVEMRGSAAKVSWVLLCSSRLPGCLEIQNGHKRLGMGRTTTTSLVPFQLSQPGRNQLRHALRKISWIYSSGFTRVPVECCARDSALQSTVYSVCAPRILPCSFYPSISSTRDVGGDSSSFKADSYANATPSSCFCPGHKTKRRSCKRKRASCANSPAEMLLASFVSLLLFM